jgi:type III restriction enzyme
VTALRQTTFGGGTTSEDFLQDWVINEFGAKTIREMLLPTYVMGNMSRRFEERYYQTEAFNITRLFIEEYEMANKKPVHVLYEMATGSGKTPLMAELMIYLYKQGYRNFLFFVNSTTVIDKTRINFTDKTKKKYLFADEILIDGQVVEVNEVQSFEEANENDINILFTTIQGLHSRMNTPKENMITYADFEDLKIVMLSDEAHHTNATTIAEKREEKTWEDTIANILFANKENILMEFTATAKLNNKNVREKYHDKLIYQYDLRQFRKDKYSKDVMVHDSDTDAWERILQAIIVSQYRKKVAIDHDLYVKPVVLFKSNYVNPPKNRHKNAVVSEEIEEEFHEKLRQLSKEELQNIEQHARHIVADAFNYFKRKGISYDSLIKELQVDFSPERCIAVNSKEETEENQVLVNNLEEPSNEIRAIFVVDKLNEGWDVLNLYDIVRLYDTKAESEDKPGKTTVKEAQLIGRGARNYPYRISEEQPMNKRKYDGDQANELRCLETLHFHCKRIPTYIKALRSELIRTGILDEEKPTKIIEKMKPSFKRTAMYKRGKIMVNKRIPHPRTEIHSLREGIKEVNITVQLPTGKQEDIKIMENGEFKQENGTQTKEIKLKDVDEHVIRYAMQKMRFFKFEWLKRYYPHIKSKQEFITSSDYLGDMKITIAGTYQQMQQINQQEKLQVAYHVLSKIQEKTLANSTVYKGTEEFYAVSIKDIFNDLVYKVKLIKQTGHGIPMSRETNRELRMDLEKKDWYIFEENHGTSEEKHFLRYFDRMQQRLREHYDNIYLIRNEQKVNIYSFKDGRTFQPDFILTLSDKNKKKQVLYQLFIEPKGDQWKGDDETFEEGKEAWKQHFLNEIKEKAIPVYTDKKIRIIGLPFYNKETEETFSKAFQQELLEN